MGAAKPALRPLRLGRRPATNLLRMRIGSSPLVGGYRYSHTDPCPACRTPLDRRSRPTAVEHWFVCPALAAFRASSAAPDFQWHPRALWEHPLQMSRVIEAFRVLAADLVPPATAAAAVGDGGAATAIAVAAQ